MTDKTSRRKENVHGRDEYINNLPDKITAIDNTWKRLCNVGWDMKIFSRLSHSIEKISGESKDNGFDEIAHLAQTVQLVLNRIREKGSVPAETEKYYVEVRLKQLYRATRNLPNQMDTGAHGGRDDVQMDMVYVVDDDEYMGTYLTLILKAAGYKTRLFETLDEFYHAYEENTPDIIIMDIVFPEGNFAGIDAINRLHAEMGSSVPIVFMSARTDAVARIRALRAGGCAYITKPIMPDVLLSTIENNSSRRQRKKRALIIDDDIEMIEHCRILLEKENIDVASITDPLETVHEIEVFDPDVLMIDYNMPRCNGEELVRLLRQDDRYINLPVIMLVTEREPELEKDILALGGISFLVRPLCDEALVVSVSSSIKTSRRSKKRMLEILKYHPGGLVNLGFFYSELESIITSLPGTGRASALLCLAIDDPQKLRAKVGLQGLDALGKKIAGNVRSLIHENQIIAQSTEFVYLLLMHYENQQQLEKEMGILIAELAQQEFIIRDIVVHVTASIGAVALTSNVRTVDMAVEYAESASLTASRNGGNQHCIKSQDEPLQGTPLSGDGNSIIEALTDANLRIQYQPIVNIEEEENVYEAYARYVEGENVLSPEMFMPWVHQKQLQSMLNKQVVTRVLEDLNDSGSYDSVTRRIIVKIEPEDSSMEEFLHWLDQQLAASGGTSRIILSFREEWLLRHKAIFEGFQDLVRKYGFGIAIEYAGDTEYTVELVQAVRPVFAKLSTTFVESLLSGNAGDVKEKLDALLSTGTGVIASSVENADIFARLMALGIHQFQGYFLQRPESGFNFEFTHQHI